MFRSDDPHDRGLDRLFVIRFDVGRVDGRCGSDLGVVTPFIGVCRVALGAGQGTGRVASQTDRRCRDRWRATAALLHNRISHDHHGFRPRHAMSRLQALSQARRRQLSVLSFVGLPGLASLTRRVGAAVGATDQLALVLEECALRGLRRADEWPMEGEEVRGCVSSTRATIGGLAAATPSRFSEYLEAYLERAIDLVEMAQEVEKRGVKPVKRERRHGSDPRSIHSRAEGIRHLEA